MRITSGSYKGMVLAVPATGDIRPTQDRVRESLFGILAPELGGSVFADLFAGSGAAGLEALSRGARKAIFVERDRRHAAVLEKNIASAMARGLESARASVAACDAFAWAARSGGEKADIVFADPPYATGVDAEARLMAALASSGALAKGGLFVSETASRASAKKEETPQWDLLREREYGASRIRIWRLLT